MAVAAVAKEYADDLAVVLDSSPGEPPDLRDD